MNVEALEAEALKLAPQERARLAQKLIESLENLSADENASLWAEEAKRQDRAALQWNRTHSASEIRR